MPYHNKRDHVKKESKSNSTGCLMIFGVVLLGFIIRLYDVASYIILSINFTDLLFYGFVVLGTILLGVKAYFRIRKWRFERKKCAHGISGGFSMVKCSLCLEEIQNQLIEEEIRSVQQENLIRIQVEARKSERAFLGKLDSIRNTSLEKIREIDPYEFEKKVGNLFRKMGYRVEQTPRSNDKGKDLILIKQGQKFLVECKRNNSSNLVGRPELQKFYAAIIEDNAELGYFVTTSDFTSTSKSYIKDIGRKIKLINGSELINMMKSAFPNEGDEEKFMLMCRECGENVDFGFPFENFISCSNNHALITNEKSIRVRLIREQPPIAPYCPKCGTTMLRRSSKKFNKLFWGCSNYPNCYGRLPYEF